MLTVAVLSVSAADHIDTSIWLLIFIIFNRCRIQVSIETHTHYAFSTHRKERAILCYPKYIGKIDLLLQYDRNVRDCVCA